MYHCGHFQDYKLITKHAPDANCTASTPTSWWGSPGRFSVGWGHYWIDVALVSYVNVRHLKGRKIWPPQVISRSAAEIRYQAHSNSCPLEHFFLASGNYVNHVIGIHSRRSPPSFFLPSSRANGHHHQLFCAMDGVHQRVRDALSEYHSIRLLFDLPTKLLDPADFLGSASAMIKDFIETWKDQAETRHLAVVAYPRHTYCVVDFNNDAYDWNTAHTQLTVLPVYMIRWSRSVQWKVFRYKPRELGIAEEIARLHDFKGWVPTPLLNDHTKGPVMHYTPRSLRPPTTPQPEDQDPVNPRAGESTGD